MKKLILLISVLFLIHNTCMAYTNPWQNPQPIWGGVATNYSGQGGSVVQNTGSQSIPLTNPTGGYNPTANQVLGTQNTVVNPSQNGGGQPTQPQQTQQQTSGFTTPEGSWFQGTLDQYNSEIQNSFNAGMGAWNVAEQNVNKDLETVTGQLTTDQAANEAQLTADKTSALGNLATQQRAGQTKKEDAMAAARRLYAEMQMGLKQRFGGATSAGGAASEIQGAEFQRQQGQTSRQANEFFQQIDTAKNDVESKFTAGLASIKQQTQQMLTQAKLNFSNMITQIAQGRAQTEQQKSQMRINALMDLRNQAFQVQQQKVLAEQALTQMREQARLNIESYKQTSGGAVQQGATNLNTLTQGLSQPAQFSGVNQQQQQQQTQPVGQIQGTQKKYNPMTGQYE